MDPFSISVGVLGLIGTIQGLIKMTYTFGKEASEAKKEIRMLCSELFALKGALECAKMNVDISLDATANTGEQMNSQSVFSSKMFGTREFRDMVEATQTLLAELTIRFTKMQERGSSLKTSLKWPFIKDEVEESIRRLERLKFYFVLATTSENLEISKQLHRQMHSLTQILNSQQHQQNRKAQDEFRKSVRCWLAPFNTEPAYRAALATEHPGTGQWFLQGDFSRWLDGHTSTKMLLLKGKPGIGKTTLMSTAIQEYQKKCLEASLAVYYFCSFTDLSSQDPVNLLGSLISQLCDKEHSLWGLVEAAYREAHKGTDLDRLTLSQAQSIFSQACNALPGLTVFLDAINESEQATTILSTIWRLIDENQNLRVIISSTEELFASAFQDTAASLFTVDMKPEEVAVDIKGYVESWLGKHEKLRSLPRRLKNEIRSRLLLSSEGMFRWVHCQLQALVVQKTPLGIKAALDAVPATLEQTYCNILLRISKEDRRIAQQALLWLAYSTRPLAFEELCEAAVVDERYLGVDENARLLQPDDLLTILSSLIHFDSKKDTVVLAHSSVLLYLTSDHIRESDVSGFYIDPSKAHTKLTRLCISYLCSEELADGYRKDAEDLDEREEDLPLLYYAARNWRIHAHYLEREQRTIDETTKTLLLRFFETASRPLGGNFGSWVQLYMLGAELIIEDASPTYYAARFGLLGILKMILSVQGTKDLERQGGRRGSTPLHAASAFGHLEVVNVLLAAGAQIREHNAKGECALQWAVLYGSDTVVRRLIEAGADPDYRNLQGHTPLYYAMRYEHKSCAKVLLEAGASQDNIDGHGKSAARLGEQQAMTMDEILGYNYSEHRHQGKGSKGKSPVKGRKDSK